MENKKGSQGFTLWETLAAAAIGAVLLAVGFLAVAGYQRTIQLTQMDKAAQALFMAAQNQMAYARATGEWQTLTENMDRKYFGSAMEEKPEDFSQELTWRKGDYFWIDYKGEKSKREDSILEVLLPFGAIEEEIRTEGSYVVEYDYRQGMVYGVFYTEDGVIDYDRDIIEGIDKNGGRSQDKEGKNYRKNYRDKEGRKIMGYYGGAAVERLEPETLEAPEAEIENGDALVLTIRDNNYHKLMENTVIRSLTSLRILGEESGAVRELLLEPGQPQDWWSYEDQGTARIYRAVLDTAGPGERRFAGLFPEFIPGENLLVEVKVSSSHVLGIPAEVRVHTNSLFLAVEDLGEEPGKQMALISSVRHLQNLSSGFSGVNQKEGIEIVKACQTEDLDWEAFLNTAENQENIQGFYSIQNEKLQEYEGTGKTLANFHFLPDARGGAGLFARLDGESRQQLLVKNLVLRDFISAGFHGAGLVGEAESGSRLWAENIVLENPTVTAGEGAGGALAGSVDSGMLENCRVYLGEGESQTAGEKYQIGAMKAEEGTPGEKFRIHAASGISGGLIGQGKNLEIRNSFAAVPVSAGKDGSAGGLTGILEEGGASSIVNCFTGGFTDRGEYTWAYGVAVLGDSGAAGGLIGRDKGNTKTEKSYSTCSVYGAISGGFTGLAEASEKIYKDCYALGQVFWKNPEEKQGPFLGLGLEHLNLSECYYLEQQPTTVESTTAKQQQTVEKQTAGNQASGLEPAGYEELIAMSWYSWQSVSTYPYDSSREDREYPFPMTTGAGQEGGIHYGDWPGKAESSGEDEGGEETEGWTLGLVYYEVVEGKLYYHGYMASPSEEGTVYQEIMTQGEGLAGGLLREKNKFVTEDGYLVLVPRNMERKDIAAAYGTEGPSGEFKTLEACTENFEDTRGFVLEGYQPYVVNFTYAGRGQKLYLGQNLSPYYPVFGETVSFRVNLHLGDTVRPGDEEEANVYKIRSARHLQQMKALSWSHTEVSQVEYVQELDIRLSGMDFTENSVPADYIYQKPDQILASYTVQSYDTGQGVRSCAIWGMEGPMFGAVRSGSRLQGIRLYDSKSRENGALAVTNEGHIEDCRVEDSTGEITVETDQGPASGFVGNNYGTIRNCRFSGKVRGQEAYGLSQINQGTVENFEIHVLEPGKEGYEEIQVEAAETAAGAVGVNRGILRQISFTGTVSGTWCAGFVGLNEGSVEACYANSILTAKEEGAGFVRSINGGQIQNCFAVGNIRGGLLAAGFGAGDNNNGTMENCYAALFGLEGEQVYRFLRGGGQEYRDCYWLNNSYVSGEIQGEGENSWEAGERGTPISYEELEAQEKTWKTYPYGSGYANTQAAGKNYPFPLWSSSFAEGALSFWGDWPQTG